MTKQTKSYNVLSKDSCQHGHVPSVITLSQMNGDQVLLATHRAYRDDPDQTADLNRY